MAELAKQRKSNIFKGLKFHLNELKRLRPDYEVLLIALQGSQNYNLDLYTDEYISDVDTVAIVLPTFENLINKDEYISETIILDNKEHIDVKDIRLILDLFRKQNIKYLEILHTDFRILNPLFKDNILELLSNASMITSSDPAKLVTCAYGMALNKLEALERPYPSLADKISKYGYDGKQLHHILRIHLFVEKYIESLDFKESINANNYREDNVEILTMAKLSKFSLQEAKDLANGNISTIKTLREYASNKYNNASNEDAVKSFFNKLSVKIFEKYLKSLFTPKETESWKRKRNYKLPTADKIFVTSDLHFGHENILKFEEERWDLCGITQHQAMVNKLKDEGLTDEEIYNIPDDIWDKYVDEVNKDYIKIHDEELIKRWNDTIKHDDDLVYILGDLSFRNSKETNDIVKRLRGRKILVLGNHDNICLGKDFDKSLFEKIVDYEEISINNKKIIMFHFPISSWKQKEFGSIHLYGHVHSNSHYVENIRNSYNVGVDVNNFKPICLENYLQITKHHDLLLNASKNIEKVYKNT